MFCITTGLVQMDSYIGIARLVLLVTLHLVLCFSPCRQARDARHHGWYGPGGLVCWFWRCPSRGAPLGVSGPRCPSSWPAWTTGQCGASQVQFLNKVFLYACYCVTCVLVQTVFYTEAFPQLQFFMLVVLLRAVFPFIVGRPVLPSVYTAWTIAGGAVLGQVVLARRCTTPGAVYVRAVCSVARGHTIGAVLGRNLGHYDSCRGLDHSVSPAAPVHVVDVPCYAGCAVS